MRRTRTEKRGYRGGGGEDEEGEGGRKRRGEEEREGYEEDRRGKADVGVEERLGRG